VAEASTSQMPGDVIIGCNNSVIMAPALVTIVGVLSFFWSIHCKIAFCSYFRSKAVSVLCDLHTI